MTFPLSLSNLASVREDPRCTVSNLHLNAETAEDELKGFQRSGGHTMTRLHLDLAGKETSTVLGGASWTRGPSPRTPRDAGVLPDPCQV